MFGGLACSSDSFCTHWMPTYSGRRLSCIPEGYNGSGNKFVIYGFNNSTTALEYLSISTQTQGLSITNTGIATIGTDANVSLNLQSKGTGGIFLQAPAGTTRITVDGSTGAVTIGGPLNEGTTTITGSISVGASTAQLSINGNSITAQGSDLNIPITLQTKGTSSFTINTGATPTVRLTISNLGAVSIGTNTLATGTITTTGAISATTNVTAGSTTSYTRISAGSVFTEGSDVSIPPNISAKGSGDLTLSTNTATRLTIGGTGLATFANDLAITGTNTTTGTSTLTGNVGIGKVPSVTYKVDVLGDVNISGTFRVGGNPINSTASVWTTSGVNIYDNNTGNVGIGTTPTYKLHIKSA